MHPDKSCEMCAYVANVLPPGQLKGPLFCRRFPPDRCVIGTDANRTPIIHMDQPQVSAAQWCHEFKKREGAMYIETQGVIAQPKL